MAAVALTPTLPRFSKTNEPSDSSEVDVDMDASPRRLREVFDM